MKKLVLVLVFVLILSSCSFYKVQKKTVFSMDTEITMTAWGKNAEDALNAAEEEIQRLNEKYGMENIDKTVKNPDDETVGILSYAEKIMEKTDGDFNVFIAPVVREWGFYSEEFSKKTYRVPTKEQISHALKLTDEKESVDLGAILKGYCADRLVEILKEKGVKSAVLSLGGNVAVIGSDKSKKAWNVGIKSPFDNEVYASISACDKAVVTSGDYIRYFEKDGKKYHHIIDPKTGYPANTELSSVTVVADSGIYADSLSTALFVMGKEKAIDYWKNNRDFEMILIDKSGKIYYTQGIELNTEHEKEIIKEQ